ncbi:leucine-rich repeat domain-containing protein [Spirochaeta dissipatitropha]
MVSFLIYVILMLGLASLPALAAGRDGPTGHTVVEVYQELLPDPALRDAVREELGLPPDHQLSRADLEELEILVAREADIRNLSGLEYAVNLRELDLRTNNVQDLGPISSLTGLEWLSLRENPELSDISPLAGLSELSYLNLNLAVSVRSIRPLRRLRNLDDLLLRGVRVLDRPEERAVLLEIGPVDRLNIRDTGLRSVAVLIPGLDAGGYRDQLDLQENPIEDIELLLPYRSGIADFSPSGPRFSGRVRVRGAAAYGIRYGDWPNLLPASWELNGSESSLGFPYDFDLRLNIDLRPRSDLRFYARFESDWDHDSLRMSRPAVDQAWMAWSPFDRGLISLGLQDESWGLEGHFASPGNLIAGIDDGYSLLSSLGHGPIRLDAAVLGPNRAGPGGVSGAGDGSGGDGVPSRDPEFPRLDELLYAGRSRVSHGPLRLEAAMSYSHLAILPLRTVLGGELRAWDFALALEASAHWNLNNLPDGDGWLLARLGWESAGRSDGQSDGQSDASAGWRVEAEYLYDSTYYDARGQFIGLRIDAPGPGLGAGRGAGSSTGDDRLGEMRIILDWEHTIIDHSGLVEARLLQNLGDYSHVYLQIPVYYGPKISSYMESPDFHGGFPTGIAIGFETMYRF